MNNKPYDWNIPDSYGAGVDYQSPIELILGDLQTQIEDNCLKAVQSYGFNIDKDELRKALEYDRGQYDKGYAAALERYKRPSGEWIELETNPPDFFDHRFYICSKCGRQIDVMTPEETLYDYPYCHCGAYMRKETENEMDPS